MGHGNHWLCLFPDLENGLAEALEWLSKGTVLGQRRVAELPIGDAGGTVSVIVWPADGRLRATYVVAQDQRSGRTYLHTAFPAAASGGRHPVRIDSVQEMSWGLEARISGFLGDKAITYFDPLYALNRDRYRAGAVADVELAGIAYSMRVVPAGTTFQTAAGDVSMDGASVLVAASEEGGERGEWSGGAEEAFGVAYLEYQDQSPLPDDYQFCAPIREVEPGGLGAVPVWRYRSTVMRFLEGRREVDIDIYATRQGMPDGMIPAQGDEISGMLWLQGTLAPD